MGKYADRLPKREGPRPVSHPRRRARQEAAAVRKSARNARLDVDQLEKLEADGYGNCREAQKLRKLLAKLIAK